MNIQLTITETPTLQTEALSRFCEIMEEKGKTPEEGIADLINDVIEEEEAGK